MKETIKFHLIQFKWYRKWKGGSYYLIYNWLPMSIFWSDRLIKSCGGRAIEEEHYLQTTRTMKTAVEWLVEQLDNNLDIDHSWRTRQYINQAKEMEKQQVIDIFNELDNYCTGLTAEQYYNEIFKNK